jgi:hypothetical protein
MKLITNNSLQAFTIFLKTEKGVKEKRLFPKESIVVPETYVSEQIQTLHKRRLLKISQA